MGSETFTTRPSTRHACLAPSSGIRVDASRFLTSVKSPIDLDSRCREPLDVAFIGRSGVSAPCCQWSEEALPQDVYSDDEGFDRYWNQDVYRRLRRKRDLPSCRVCDLGRVFDESGFHLSPQSKNVLIASGQLPESHRDSDYPEEQLVRTCVENRLDLPSIRHTLRELDLPVEMSEQIESLKLAALPALDEACWDAFEKLDAPAGSNDIYVAGPFIGIGWGPPVHVPSQKISARWIGGAQAASIFVRVTPGLDCVIHVTIGFPSELEYRLQVEVCGRSIEPRFGVALRHLLLQLTYLRGLSAARGIPVRDQPFQVNHQWFHPRRHFARLRYRKPHHGKPSRQRLSRGIAACEPHPKPSVVETRQVIGDKSDEQGASRLVARKPRLDGTAAHLNL